MQGRIRWLALLMAAPLLLSLAACGGGNKGETQDAGQAASEVRPAAQATITLGEDPSSGYQWVATMDAQGILKETGNTFQAQGDGPAGARSWVFTAEGPGTVELRFEYKQGAAGEAAETIAYTFRVNDDKGIVLESSFGSVSEIPQPQMQ